MLDRFDDVIVVGETETDSSPQFDVQISKLDLFGNLKWMRTITGSNFSDAGFDVCNSLSGNYVLTGFFFDTVANAKKIMLLETDTSGVLIQLQLYGNSSGGLGMCIEPQGNSYLIVGSDLSNGLYQIVFDSLNLSSSIAEELNIYELKLYPNPIKDEFTIETDHLIVDQITSIEVLDIFGNQYFIPNFTINNRNCFVEIPENVTQGILFVRVHFNNRSSILKRIVHAK
jgi:hypothetical protein